MKIFLLFILWIIATLILVGSIIGMFLLIPINSGFSDSKKSTWMQIGYDLIQKLIK